MLASLLQRSVLPASGLLLVAGFVVQSSPLTGRLHEWTSARRPTADRPSGLSPAPAPAWHRVVAEGRVVADPGAEVIVGTEAAGRIVRLPVEEKSVVRTGDLIAELNAADLRAARDEAEARVAEAEADIRFFEREVRRDEALLARKAATPQGLDMNVRALQTARARRAAAVATRDRFDALIVKTRITAPIDGVVTARHVQPGETVRAATAIVTVADLKRVRIEAEVDEFDAAQVALGAPVTV
ncbi:MAG: efflux RND transporter periplasmic adaptor subunit, partial [Singulisphaera sp.]|nr:efflux RND transporter periplasmic adaptor subunit [Singulisphaera sp.]